MQELIKITKEEVSKTLIDSGLFERIFVDEYIRLCKKYGQKAAGRHITLLTADQAEKILARMDFQVIRSYTDPEKTNAVYFLARTWVDLSSGCTGIKSVSMANLKCNLEDGITFAMNEALAYCCTNMKTKLEQAIKELNERK